MSKTNTISNTQSTHSHIKNELDCEGDLGFKVSCGSCHETFYDLKHADPTCPGCNSLYSKTSVNKRRSTEHTEIFDETKDEDDVLQQHEDILLEDDFDLSI